MADQQRTGESAAAKLADVSGGRRQATEPFPAKRSRRDWRLLLWCTLGVLVADAVVVGFAWLAANVAGGPRCLRDVQFAGSGSGVRWEDAIAESCEEPSPAMMGTWAGTGILVPAALFLICWVAASQVYAGAARAMARWARDGVVVSAVAGGGMLLVLWVGSGPSSWVQGFALIAWIAALPAVVLAVIVTVTVLQRLAMSTIVSARIAVLEWRKAKLATTGQSTEKLEERLKTAQTMREPFPTMRQPDPASGDEAVWRANYHVPEDHTKAGLTGICLSGGGIRSATFSMGAMQAFAQKGLLRRAGYLATVSGGGYFGGSHQMLRSRGAGLEEAFLPGSPEEDHVRRHGKYIADGMVEWISAVGVVIRNVLLGLSLVAAALIIAARLLGWLYSLVPWSAGLFEVCEGTCGWIAPAYPAGIWYAVGVPLVGAFVVWVLADARVFGRGDQFHWRHRLHMGAGTLVKAALVVAMLAVGVPALAQLAEFLARGQDDRIPIQIGSLAGLVTAAVTLWNMWGRGRSESATTRPPLPQRLLTAAGFVTRSLLSALVILGLVILGLVVLGASVSKAVEDYQQAASGDHLMLWMDPWLWVTVALLALLAIFFDQTRMSLHPFYKRRLATAFNLMRENGSADEAPWGKSSTLSELGGPKKPGGADGPQLLICAAANVSGQRLTPPGRRVTPFVFTSAYVGGPRLGYVRTEDLETHLSGRTYRSDITVLAAMAVSGAAFASAMGRMSGPFNILLALSNARLGVWIPNPRYHHRRANGLTTDVPLEQWRNPLPKVRRLRYFARELTGSYSADDRFVYVSDGGHYENLGLIELLRRKCQTIYCVDASGDSSIAQTLAEAAVLAYEELGVRLSVEGVPLAPDSAVTGTAKNTQLRSLERRLSTKSVIRGRFEYPRTADAAEGVLIVGKSVLTADLPFSLRAHAVRADRFPGESTADQWFDVEQFDAYQALGRLVGEAMLDACAPRTTEQLKSGPQDQALIPAGGGDGERS